jgi:hypothetical protein
MKLEPIGAMQSLWMDLEASRCVLARTMKGTIFNIKTTRDCDRDREINCKQTGPNFFEK